MVINHNKDNKEISKLILKDNLRYDQDNIGIFIYFNRMQSKHSLLISLYLPKGKKAPDIQNENNLTPTHFLIL